MPNWVSNTITVTGSFEELQRFKDHIDVQPTYAQDGDYDGFSFHSFITLPDGTDKEVYLGTHGVVGGEEVGKEDINWYNWNMAHWNTKWDACDVEVGVARYPDPEGTHISSIHISFNTAWSPPEPVFDAISKTFPELTFQVWFEEEQGWGGSFTIKDEVKSNVNIWDIPDSHADYVAQYKECPCTYESDKDYWYDDCPGKVVNIYTIEVVTKMYIQASNEEDAIEAAKAEESGYDFPTGTTLKKTLYSEEYRVTEVEHLEEEEE